ncbi:MAG: hypothetical protein FWG89_10120 [Treponema sp.]|nr:hypothetical protein [Treponema sp.]
MTITKIFKEADLTSLFIKNQTSCIFLEVSIGSKNIFGKNSTDRKIDIVVIHGCKSKKPYNYNENKAYFLKLIQDSKNEVEIIEVKKKLNRVVIGQILVGEFMFKKKYEVKKIKKSILYHIGDDAMELFCKENKINLINYNQGTP